jgi:uncharacterized protein (TIGR02300 family)
VASDPAFLRRAVLAKADLGDKQVCPSCGAKFYDLGRRPATCPKCQTAFDPHDEAVRMKRVRGRATSYEDDEEKPEVEAEEDETVETAALDEGAAEVPADDVEADEEEGPANSDEIPAGFSEDVGEDADDTAEEDDAVPILEDEEEFPEDEIGEIGDGGEEEQN